MRHARAPLRFPDRLYIDGCWVASSSTERFSLIDSSTEEEFAAVAAADRADIDAAVGAARRAFDEGVWPQLTPLERAEYLRRLGEALAARAADVAPIWTRESGILHSLARPTVDGVAWIFSWYADLAASFPFVEKAPTLSGDLGLRVHEPVGVAACIIPWNGPIATAVFKCAPALLAGCTVVLKASPEAPGTLYLLAEACEQIGLPPGVLNLVTADREVSEYLVSHPGVDKVSFTGSSAAGRRVASLCGQRMARATLELGGKSPALLLDDCDIDRAVQVISAQAIPVTGQVCSSLTRVIVMADHQDRVVDGLAERFRTIKVGDPFDATSEMGPLATARHRQRVEACIAEGVAQGARLVTGGRRPPLLSRGFFVEPTLFSAVDPSMRIAREEIFGPVLCVIPVRNEAEAVAIANDTPYGLNASVFTEDADRALAVARRLRSGTVGHNEFRSDFLLGMGGFKQSGIGREGGEPGLRSFLETKSVILDGQPSLRALSRA